MTAPPSPTDPQASPAPSGAAAHAARHDVLARLVPPLVHRLNNCLGVIRGTLDLCEGEAGGPRVETARRESIRLGELLAGLTFLARDHAPLAGGSPEAVDLTELLRRAAELAGPYLERAGVELDLRPLHGAVVRGSEPRLFQLLVCALITAAGPLPPKPARRGSAPADRRRLRLVARDDGEGVTVTVASSAPAAPGDDSPGSLPHFFAEVAAEHGARLALRAAGPFACRLRFPAEAVLRARPAEPELPPPAPRPRLLLLETNPELGGLIPVVLEGAGYRVDVVTRPAVALEALTADHAALLVDGENLRARDDSLLALLGADLPAPVAWLGRPPDLDIASQACLPAPFRPDALLRFVADLTGCIAEEGGPGSGG